MKILTLRSYRPDKPLLITSLILLLFGLIMTYSASFIYSIELYNDGYHFFKKQLAFCMIGILCMLFFYRFKYQYVAKLIPVLLFINLLMLIGTYIPGLSAKAGGASRWLLPGLYKFQPSEITKLVLVIYLSSVISRKRERIQPFLTGFLPTILISSVFIVLILFQPDFGTALILGFLMLSMLFIGGSKKSYILSTLIASLPLVYYAIMTSDYRKRRIFAFLNPWADPQDSGFQIIQSLLAFFSGGAWGRGLGDGQQKLFYLPEAHTDFIFAVVAEELGFIGVLGVLGVFLFLLYRGFRIAFLSNDPLGTLIAFGVTSLLGFQITFNIGVVLGIFPTKGIVLPFLSYGGSALIVTMSMIGILLNISAQNRVSRNSIL